MAPPSVGFARSETQRPALDAVNFYDQRFGIGFTDTQKADLVAC
jgi:hypothetical protein